MQQELKALIGLRTDGRKNDEIRNIECKTGVNPAADGSSYFKLGITEIVCTLNGPQQVRLS
jgi:RNase PH